MSQHLYIKDLLVIPGDELTWRFSRNSGPGGQSVNKTDSYVELIFDFNASKTLTSVQKQRIQDYCGNRLVKGCLRVCARDKRTQYRNRKSAYERMANLLGAALKMPSPSRRMTRPTYGSVKRRLLKKQQRSLVKKFRKSSSDLDEF